MDLSTTILILSMISFIYIMIWKRVKWIGSIFFLIGWLLVAFVSTEPIYIYITVLGGLMSILSFMLDFTDR